MQLSFNITNNSVNMFVNGRVYTVDSSHGNYAELVEELKKPVKDIARIERLASAKNYIAEVSRGFVGVSEDGVFYKDQPINEYLSRKVLELYHAGFDISIWIRFVENLMQNPLESAKNELYLFLESSGLPLTEDGHFLAYKKVRDDYRSYRSPKDARFDHRVGNVVEEEESYVDTDRSNTCSRGLHFCAFDYLKYYYGHTGRVVVVKINPADVRAIPSDYNNAKGRTFRYTVVDEVAEDQAKDAFPTPVSTDYDVFYEDGYEDWYDDSHWDDDWDDYEDEVLHDPFWNERAEQEAEEAVVAVKLYGVDRGLSWSGDVVLKMIENHGSMASVAREYNIPVSTFKDWVYDIAKSSIDQAV